MKPSEFLAAGKAVIADPKNWTKGANARNSKGVSVEVGEGVCFCSWGAFEKAKIDKGLSYKNNPEVYRADQFLTNSAPDGLVARFNDKHSHSEVMELWDRAIAAAKAADE